MSLRIRSGLTLFLLLSAALAAPAQEKEKEKETSIFDFGKFDEAPAAQPSIAPRRKAAPASPVTPVTPPETPPETPPVPAGPAPADGRLTLPPAADLEKANTALRATFADTFATMNASARRQLARRLLKLAAEPPATPADVRRHYAALEQARDVALAAADPSLALRVQGEMLRAYDVDEYATRVATLLKLAPLATAALPAHAVAGEAIPLLEAAIRDDDFPVVDQIAPIAETAALRATPRDALMTSQVAGLMTAARAAKTHYAKAKPALDALVKNPGDAAAALDAGRYHCFVKGDWAAGLPLLARSADEILRSAANADLSAASADATKQAAVAKAWWDFAGSAETSIRPRIQERAAHWYRLAAPELSGLARAQAEQRAAAATAGPRLEPGLTAEVFWDPGLSRLVRVRVDPVISNDYATTPPDPSLSDGTFGVRWTGYLKVARPGTYTLCARVRESVRIWIDGKQVLFTGSPSDAVRRKVSLSEGLHTLRIHYNSRGPKARLNLLWALDGGFGEVMIPPSAFLHDPTQGAESMRVAGGGLMPFPPLVRTPLAASKATGKWFDDLPSEPGGVLIGLRVTQAQHPGYAVIQTIQAVFRNEAGDAEDGQVIGRKSRAATPVDLLAKDGYAVAAINAKCGDRLDGLSVTFMRLKPDGTLDPRDKYTSPWAGGQGGAAEQTVNGSTNKPMIGLYGRAGTGVYAIGLVQRK